MGMILESVSKYRYRRIGKNDPPISGEDFVKPNRIQLGTRQIEAPRKICQSHGSLMRVPPGRLFILNYEPRANVLCRGDEGRGGCLISRRMISGLAAPPSPSRAAPYYVQPVERRNGWPKEKVKRDEIKRIEPGPGDPLPWERSGIGNPSLGISRKQIASN